MLKLKYHLKLALLSALFFYQTLECHCFPYEPPREMYLIPGMSDLSHPVTTSNAEAQNFFNQGLAYKYAFNDEASYWSFQKAAKLDPDMAMAYWGMALALGTTINMPITADRGQAAYTNIQQALKLSGSVTSQERKYIEALALRYSADPHAKPPELELAYKNAMQKLAGNYLDDPDASTLYAESILNLNPSQQWTSDGKPVGDILQAIEMLESVLKRFPNHLGANHYYIHAVEGSKHPERALMSANRLRKLLPSSGHILHMPSHIYILVGDYHQAAEVNEEAVAADQEYIRQFGMNGSYPLHYMSHNLYFLVRAYCLAGDYPRALKAARNLQAFYVPYYAQAPELEEYAMAPQWVMMRFNAWEDITKLKPFPEDMVLSNALLNFVKAYALFSLKDMPEAEKYMQLFSEAKSRLPVQEKTGHDRTTMILEIAEKQLKAKQAYMQDKLPEAITLLQQAVVMQDSLNNNEPPDWYYPLRDSLGYLLFKNRDYTEAEKVFRESTDRLPRNGRSLFGLLATLKAQDKNTDAFWVQKQFEDAWQYGSAPMKIENLF